MDKKVLAYNLTESISEASKGSLAYVINPNHDGMSVLVSADALKALTDSHDKLLAAAKASIFFVKGFAQSLHIGHTSKHTDSYCECTFSLVTNECEVCNVVKQIEVAITEAKNHEHLGR